MGEQRLCGLTEKECKKLQHFLQRSMVNGRGKIEFTCQSCDMDNLLRSPKTLIAIKRDPEPLRDLIGRIKESDIFKMSNASPMCPLLGVRVVTVCRFKACPYYIKHKHVFYKNCLLVAAEHAKSQPKGLGDVDISRLLNVPVVIVKEMLNKAYNNVRQEKFVNYLAENRPHLYKRLQNDLICVVCGKKHESLKTCSHMSRTGRVVCKTECVKPPQWVIDLEDKYDDEFMVLYFAANSVFSGDVNVIASLFNTNQRSLRAHIMKLKHQRMKGDSSYVRIETRQTA